MSPEDIVWTVYKILGVLMGYLFVSMVVIGMTKVVIEWIKDHIFHDPD